MNLKIKICGMNHNVQEVSLLHPAYLGFIFYKGSPRNFDKTIPPLPNTIKKVGVFVNETIETILEKVKEHEFQVLQLHGDESADYLASLRDQIETSEKKIELWKVFSIGETLDFSEIAPFEKHADKYLFDTQGKKRGGNGRSFNWEVLTDYPFQTPFILSGGIGPESISAIRALLKKPIPLHGIDLNSRFETEPGLKNITQLKKFIHALSS